MCALICVHCIVQGSVYLRPVDLRVEFRCPNCLARLIEVERAFSWRPVRGAAYYQVLLQRGATTIYEARNSKRTAAIRLKLRPGRYHAVVRPAIPNSAGITLGSAIVDKIVRV